MSIICLVDDENEYFSRPGEIEKKTGWSGSCWFPIPIRPLLLIPLAKRE